MGKEFSFSSDYIEILTSEYDTIIFTPIYSKDVGLYLSVDGEKPIKDIMLLNSRIIINYLSGETKLIDIPILSVTIEDGYFKRRTKAGIAGTLFRYSVNDALQYEFDIEKSFNYETINPKTRKRGSSKSSGPR